MPRLLLVAIVAVMLVGGVAALLNWREGTVETHSWRNSYSPSFVDAGVAVVAVGEPPGFSPRPPAWTGLRAFTGDPRGERRLIIVFNPPWSGSGGDSICRGTPPPAEQGSGALEVSFDFCVGGRAVSSARLSAPAAVASDPQKTANAIDNALLRLLPPTAQ